MLVPLLSAEQFQPPEPSFEVVPGHPESPVVLHVPHAATRIPDDVRAGIALDDAELAAELAAITDAGTGELAAAAADRAVRRPWIFRNRLSRLVVDPERFPDEREELAERGMGAVYERTTDLRVLRTPSDPAREALLARYYRPYAAAVAALVGERLVATGRATVLDVHSYPLARLPYELHPGPRPEVCLGTDAFHTPPGLVTAARRALAPATPTGQVLLDTPFAGCYVPLDHYRREPAVHALMLELRRDVLAARGVALAAGVANLVDDVSLGVVPPSSH